MSTPALSSAWMASGLILPLGWLPALNARTGLFSFRARWLSIASASTLRAELCVKMNSTLMSLSVIQQLEQESGLTSMHALPWQQLSAR